jgi:hypothetical protein
MKVPFPENEALFGIDHDGENRWYCWRLPHGCRGKLGQFTKTAEGIFEDRFPLRFPAVEIDNQFHFDNGAWRLNRRGKSRDKGASNVRSEAKKHRRTAAQLGQQEKTMRQEPYVKYFASEPWSDAPNPEFSEAFSREAEELRQIAHDPRPHLLQVNPAEESALPARIECPACGAMNRIPAPQGAIKVRAGAVLPTCTDKRE